DSDVLVCSLGSTGSTILVVDGYDRWNAQSGGVNHTFLEKFADALSGNGARYDSCVNEALTGGSISLSDYSIVMWMSGEETTESETLSYDEQILLQNYLKQGGALFISGAEIGWDLIARGGSLNNYSNGSDNDTAFHRNFLKAEFVSDDANTYSVTGVNATGFAGLSFSFDDGTRGTYNVRYPDVLATYGGSTNALYYGAGPNVAGIVYSGTFPDGTFPGKLVYFGFPFETIYDVAARTNVMSSVLAYLTPTPVNLWQMY
ncbi:MAG TPA: hypothetical protein PKH07_11890, partial [bacterium]|nr:hypothetical protein [bacterium]